MSLGQRIRHLRQSRGLTQSQLGGSELSKSFISLLEKDRTQPSVQTLHLIARRLGTSVDSLLGQEGNIPEMVCEGLLTLTRDAVRSRNADRASRLLETVSYLASAHGLAEASREAMLLQAQVALEQRQFAQAAAKAIEAQRLSETAEDHWRLGRALLVMGQAKVRQREFPAAAEILTRALATLRRARAGRDPARVEALITLGTTMGYMGEFARALSHFEEAAHAEAARHDDRLRGQAVWGLGLAHLKLERHRAARDYLLQARDAFEKAEELPDLVRVLHTLGQLTYDEGSPKEALRYLHQALRVMDRLHVDVSRVSTLDEIARIHLNLGNVEEAGYFAEQALDGAKKVGDPVKIAEAQVIVARVQVRRGQATTAVGLLKQAVAAFQDRKMQGKLVEAARELGLLLRDQGAHADAAAYLALSLDQPKEASSSGDRIAAQADS